MLLFNIVPLLGLGQMQVYTQTYSENQFHSFRVLKRNPVKAWLGKRGEKHNKSIGVIAYNTITNEKKDMVP